MKIKYRKLTSRIDPQEFSNIYEQGMSGGRRSASRALESAAVAAVTAPKQVKSEDGEGELAEVEQMLRAGELALTDLVDCGNGWTTVEEAYELSDVCETLLSRRQRAGRLKMVLFVAIGMLLAAALAFLMLSGRGAPH